MSVDPPPPAPSPLPRQPGETPPAGRRLARPPGERFPVRVPEVILERPETRRAVGMGMLAVAGIALLSALVHAVLSNAIGQVAIPLIGGWCVGFGVRRGAWGGRPHRPSGVPTRLAVVLAGLTWALGLLLAWLVSQAILQGSSRSLPERLAATPFLDWLTPQLSVMDAVRLLLLVVAAWAGSRSTSQERPGLPPG